MNTPRFNYDRNPGAISRPRTRKYSKWTRLPHIGPRFLRNSTGPERRKIYAIVAPRVPADLGRKRIRRVLIFDNHPNSIRLVFGRRLTADVDLGAPKTTGRGYVILGLVPILLIVLVTVWLLL
jgi:hypothetical protein